MTDTGSGPFVIGRSFAVVAPVNADDGRHRHGETVSRPFPPLVIIEIGRRCRTLHTLQIGFPLHGKHLFLVGVARLARRYDIAFGGLAAPGDGNDVIHGQLGGRRLPAAIMTTPLGALPLPPRGAAQLTRLAPLGLDARFVQVIGIGAEFAHHTSRSLKRTGHGP